MTKALATLLTLIWLSGCHAAEKLTASRSQTADRPATTGQTEAAAIVVLHGYGSTPDSIRRLVDDFDDSPPIVTPRGTDPAGAGWSWFPLSAAVGGLDKLGPDIASAADALAVTLREDGYGETRPVAVTGFSQGGMLSFALATRHPDLVSLAVPIGGMLPSDLADHAPPPSAPAIHALHGGDDQRVPVASAQGTVERLRERGWPATLSTWPGVGHSVSGPMKMKLNDLLRTSQPSEL